ncbi:MAG: type IV pilin protein [Magnetococcus sp. THC-1_WYH]
MKGQRREATTALLEASSKQTQYFMDNKTYASDLTLLGYTANPYTTEQGAYQISVTTPTVACPIASCFALAATPLGSQTADTCGTFTITSTNAKSASTSDCW